MAPDEVVQFPDREALWSWLADHHATSPGVWVRLGRSRGPLQSITFHDLLEAGLAYGWSESTRRGFDEASYLQRFSPRRSPGTTSQRNLRIAERLESEGRMTPPGRAALGLPTPKEHEVPGAATGPTTRGPGGDVEAPARGATC